MGKKAFKILFVLTIVVSITLFLKQKKIIEQNNEKIDLKSEVLSIKIIDKNNLMEKLHKEAEEENWEIVDLIINGKYYSNVGIRTKGSTVYNWMKIHASNKYSYKVKLDYINSNQEFNGMKEIHLNSQVMDATEIREYLIYDVYNKLGIQTQQYCFANLYINNENIGLMTLVEVINEEFVENKYGSTKGNLYKPEMQEHESIFGAELQYKGDDINSYRGIFDYTKSINTTKEDKLRLIKIIKKLKLEQDKKEIEKQFYDFDKVIKMVAINKALSNIDNFAGISLRNFYLYEENEKIDIMCFDFNMSLGMCISEYVWTQEDVEAFSLIEINKPIHSRIIDIIYEHDEYHEKYVKYMKEALLLINSLENNGYINDINKKVSPIIKSGNRNIYSEGQYEDAVDDLKAFINKRTEEFLLHDGNTYFFKNIEYEYKDNRFQNNRIIKRY